MKGRYDDLHGDEGIIEAEQRELRERYEEERADDWKYDPENWGERC